jgi:hypothetical protein
MWSAGKRKGQERVTVYEEKAKDKHEKCTKRRNDLWNIFRWRCRKKFVRANHLQFKRQFYLHKLTVLWNIYLNWSS